MQPNNQQGYGQPEQPQPVQPTQPLVLQPVSAQPSPQIDSAALQAALDEPIPVVPTSMPISSPSPIPEQTSLPAAPEYTNGQFPEGDEDVEVFDPEEAPVSWVAHEYIHQEKGAAWFMIFAVVIVALIAAAIFLMNSWSFAVLLAVIAVVVVVYSRRPPRELTYSITDEGLYVDDKLHRFESFKSFGVIRDGEHFSVMLIPTQRFQPGITVYFPEDAGEAIVDTLGSVLPMKELNLDVVDRIVRLLRL